MKQVRFTKHNLPYMAGELASFSEQIAEDLVKSGVAVYHEAEAKVRGAKSVPTAIAVGSARKSKADSPDAGDQDGA